MLAKEACQCLVPACDERGAMGAHQQGDDNGQNPYRHLRYPPHPDESPSVQLVQYHTRFFDIKQAVVQDGSRPLNSLNFFIILSPYKHLQQPYLVVLACY